MNQLNIGDTFIWFPPDGRKEHLFIVVTNPANNGGRFAAFNLTKSKGGPKALTFQIGDHPYITRYPSDVNFGDAMIFDQSTVAASNAVPQAPIKIELIRKIVSFAVGHPAIPEEVEDMVKSDWNI